MDVNKNSILNPRFWSALDGLVNSCELHIDRPKNSRHPKYPDLIYPLDYGFLGDTTASDNNCIDVWNGSLAQHVLTAIAVTVDLTKRDSEIKLLLDCTDEEIAIISAFHNNGPMSAIIIKRDDRNK